MARKVHFRFFLHSYGAEYVPCKEVNRNGKIFFRNVCTGEEMPAGKTARHLTGAMRDDFVRAYNTTAAARLALQRKIHPEDKKVLPVASEATYDEIIASIVEMYHL